jgi:hypothetical protein
LSWPIWRSDRFSPPCLGLVGLQRLFRGGKPAAHFLHALVQPLTGALGGVRLRGDLVGEIKFRKCVGDIRRLAGLARPCIEFYDIGQTAPSGGYGTPQPVRHCSQRVGDFARSKNHADRQQNQRLQPRHKPVRGAELIVALQVHLVGNLPRQRIRLQQLHFAFDAGIVRAGPPHHFRILQKFCLTRIDQDRDRRPVLRGDAENCRDRDGGADDSRCDDEPDVPPQAADNLDDRIGLGLAAARLHAQDSRPPHRVIMLNAAL